MLLRCVDINSPILPSSHKTNLSTGINALAAILVEGALSSCGYRPTERRATIITKFAAAVVGIMVVGLAFIAQYMRGPVTQMVGSINGSFGSPVVGVFLLASIVPWSNKYGVATGVISSVAFMLTLTLGGQTYGAIPKPLPPTPVSGCLILNGTFENDTSLVPANSTAVSDKYGYRFFLFDISYEWYTVLGTLFCMAVGLLVSLLTRHTVPETDQPGPELIMPFCRRFWLTRGYLTLRSDVNGQSQDGLDKTQLEGEPDTKVKSGSKDLYKDSVGTGQF